MVILWLTFAFIGLMTAVLSFIVIGSSNYYLKQDVVILLLGLALFAGSTIQLSNLFDHSRKSEQNPGEAATADSNSNLITYVIMHK